MADFKIDDRFVLFVDFLGSSNAAKNWNSEQTQPLLDLLIELASSQSAFNITGGPRPDGSYAVNITPEFSAFSDHFVSSYPTDIFERARELHAHLPDLIWDMLLERIQRTTGIIAIKALHLGLLIRGGFSVGKPYHSDGVVFGEGMIDAYHLESQVATYPRIATSPKIYTKLPESSRQRLLQDKDGIWHIDYFSRLDDLMIAAGKTSDEIKSWRHTSLETIDANIQLFEKKESLNELRKWTWFKAHFQKP